MVVTATCTVTCTNTCDGIKSENQESWTNKSVSGQTLINDRLSKEIKGCCCHCYFATCTNTEQSIDH